MLPLLASCLLSFSALHASHTLRETTPLLVFEDGSRWEVSDVDLTEEWGVGDPLSITPNTSWFSSYDYWITHLSTHATVKANFHSLPDPSDSHGNWMVDVDLSGHILLQNGNVWCTDPRDLSLLRGWSMNDPLVLGDSSTKNSYYNHILINTNTDEYVRVQRYQ